MATAVLDRFEEIVIQAHADTNAMLANYASDPAAGYSYTLTVAESRTAMYLFGEGWSGMDSPSMQPTYISPIASAGEKLIRWRPGPRQVSIPVIRPRGVSREPLDRIIASGLPLSMKFTKPDSSDPDLYLLGCHFTGETQISQRAFGWTKHFYNFTSQWSYFVQAPTFSAGTPGNPVVRPVIHGIRFVSTSSWDAGITWGATTNSVHRIPSGTFMWTPSPPFASMRHSGFTMSSYLPYDTGTAITKTVTGTGGTYQFFYILNSLSI